MNKLFIFAVPVPASFLSEGDGSRRLVENSSQWTLAQ